MRMSTMCAKPCSLALNLSLPLAFSLRLSVSLPLLLPARLHRRLESLDTRWFIVFREHCSPLLCLCFRRLKLC